MRAEQVEGTDANCSDSSLDLYAKHDGSDFLVGRSARMRLRFGTTGSAGPNGAAGSDVQSLAALAASASEGKESLAQSAAAPAARVLCLVSLSSL